VRYYCLLQIKIHKTALGATETVNWEHKKNVLDVISNLKKENIITLAIEQVECSLLQDFAATKTLQHALVFC
jgi:hypothetical protein